MIGNTYQQLFLMGANQLAAMPVEYGEEQQAAGFTSEEWKTLTTDRCWTSEQRRQLPTMLSAAVSITLRTAGLPPAPLPGAYVAAVICKLIAPCNRIVAASEAPQSFDVMAAAGISSESVVKDTTREQMFALVTYFSSAEYAALESFPIDKIIEAHVLEEQRQSKVKK